MEAPEMLHTSFSGNLCDYVAHEQQAPPVDPFNERLRESLQRETLNSRSVRIARHANVYTCGDQDEMVYYIESGQIKLLMQADMIVIGTHGRSGLPHMLLGSVAEKVARMAPCPVLTIRPETFQFELP